MKHPFLWALILWSLSTVWPMWCGHRTRGIVLVATGVMPFIAFLAGWWIK